MFHKHILLLNNIGAKGIAYLLHFQYNLFISHPMKLDLGKN